MVEVDPDAAGEIGRCGPLTIVEPPHSREKISRAGNKRINEIAEFPHPSRPGGSISILQRD